MHSDAFNPYGSSPARPGGPRHDSFRVLSREVFPRKGDPRRRRDPTPAFPRATDLRPVRDDDDSKAEGVRVEVAPEGVRRFTLQLDGGEVLIAMDCAPRIVNDAFLHLLVRLLGWLSVRYGNRSTMKVVR